MTDVTLELKAPLSGPIVALEDVPDPVFSQKMVGDGISIDPINETLFAPCDGKIVQLHRANHAVTLETDSGLEIMMHIGIDTVGLKGVGFLPQVKLGDNVNQGDALIRFDADFIATKAKSLLTQIIVTNSDRVASFDYGSGSAEAGTHVILRLEAKAAESVRSAAGGKHITSSPIAIPNPTGLHARPTAMLVNEAKKFTSVIHLYKGGEQANAKSLVSIMGLEVNCGDEVSIVATGDDAEQAVAALEAAVRSGLGEDCSTVDAVAHEEIEEEAPRSSDPNIVLGVTASPGLAIGQVFQLKREELDVPELAKNDAVELKKLDDALINAHRQLDSLQAKIEDKDKAAIFAAHQALLQDPELLDSSREQIADGKTAAFAWRNAYMAQSNALSKLKNELLAARANDLRDVGRRVLQLILGLDPSEDEVPAGSILIAEDLTPSDTANIDRTKVLGFCTVTGGASSHVAILARSLNLPAIAGIEHRALDIANGSRVILDASHARLTLNPSDDAIEKIERARAALEKKREEDLANAKFAATTIDGHHVEVVANIAGEEDAAATVSKGGEGAGLCRSEFLFMNRANAPNEDEQFAIYSAMANRLAPGQPLIIRTLDVGGDKPLPYLPIEEEENPFLGLRGIRVCLQRPSIFRTQLRAILRAAESSRSNGANIMVMFPMVTTLEDLRQAKRMLEEERKKLAAAEIPVGIMVEVPTTAIMSDQFAEEVDFFSIGTNDLTQYTLAIDRGHPALAAQADGLNPGVLALIANTVKGAHKHKAWVGICGGIASDAVAVPILLGLGVDELSVSVPSIPEIKATVRSCELDRCKEIAEQALLAGTASDVRALVAQHYPDLI